jgi:hypothetical protein
VHTVKTLPADQLLNNRLASESEDEDEDQAGELPEAFKDNERNSHLTMGYKGDRSYVVRGNKIGVFSTDTDGVRYQASLKGLKTNKGKEFKPKDVSLQNCLQSSSDISLDHATRPGYEDDHHEPWRTQFTVQHGY